VFHGGPGFRCTRADLGIFDPTVYRVALFNQRGCPDTRPSSGVDHRAFIAEHPFTWRDLARDADLIRRTIFGEEANVIVFGGSWGSTLALLYASEFPQSVDRAVVFGLFAGTRHEHFRFYGEEARKDGPEGTACLVGSASPIDDRWWRGSHVANGLVAIMESYTNEILSSGSRPAMVRWAAFEAYREYVASPGLSKFWEAESLERMRSASVCDATEEEQDIAISQATLFLSLMNDVETFPGGPDQFWRNAGKRMHGHCKVRIVQGGADCCCQPSVATWLARVLSDGTRATTCEVVPHASHNPFEDERMIALLHDAVASA
jgi:pimeloyl-ACP methyl ester carboxylesterase